MIAYDLCNRGSRKSGAATCAFALLSLRCPWATPSLGVRLRGAAVWGPASAPVPPSLWACGSPS
eukprot:5607523-Alexandrium_andersonii.AAC.1